MRVRAKQRLFRNNVLYEPGQVLVLDSKKEFDPSLHEDAAVPMPKKSNVPAQAHLKREPAEEGEEAEKVPDEPGKEGAGNEGPPASGGGDGAPGANKGRVL
jgi:hypothetical protein